MLVHKWGPASWAHCTAALVAASVEEVVYTDEEFAVWVHKRVLVWACMMAEVAEGGAHRMVLAAEACKPALMAPYKSVSWLVPCTSVWEAPGIGA